MTNNRTGWWARLHGDTKALLTRTAGLYSAQIVRGGLVLACNMLSVRLLEPREFGRFAFVQSLLVFSFLFEVGMASSTRRLFVFVSGEEEQRRLHGAWLLVFLPILATFVAVLILVSGPIETLFQLEVGHILRVGAFFATGILLYQALMEIVAGCGAIKILIGLNLLPSLLFLGFLSMMWYSGETSVELMVLAYTFSFFLTSFAALVFLKPDFRRPRGYIRNILAETRTFGIHDYLSHTIGVGTFQLDAPLIAYFTKDPASVGFYGLAKQLVSMITLFSHSLRIVLLRSLPAFDRIPKRFFIANYLWLVASCGVMFVLNKPLVSWALPPEYASLLPLLSVWTAVAFLQGSFQLQNGFLMVTGQGIGLRNIAVLFGITNVVANFLLIPRYGAMGASIASGIAYLVWNLASTILYRQVVESGERQDRSLTGNP